MMGIKILFSVLMLAYLALNVSCADTHGQDQNAERDLGIENLVENAVIQEMQVSKNKQHSSFVGFTAYKHSPQFYEPEEKVTFDGILLNEGDHYKPESNSFVCPHNGIYFVAVSFQKYNISELNLNVMKESQVILQPFESYSDNPWSVTSNSGIVRCNKSEHIWVEGYYEPGAIYGESDTPVSTFTVILMHQGDYIENLHENFAGFTSFYFYDYQSYVNGSTIKFDATLFNEGSHFKPDLNCFVCPKDGIYFLTVNLRKFRSNMLQLGVVMGTSTLILHSEDIWASNYYTTLSNSRLFRCEQSDFVAVEGTGDGYVNGFPNGPRTTFSAMLMHEEGHINESSKQHISFVGFTAYKKINQTYGPGDIIGFEGILLNEGNHFQPIFNRFVCPHDAIYYVSITLKKYFSQPLQLDVMQGSNLLLRIQEFDTNNPWYTASNSALVRCTKGEVIRVVGTDTGAIFGHESKIITTFTVIMMH